MSQPADASGVSASAPPPGTSVPPPGSSASSAPPRSARTKLISGAIAAVVLAVVVFVLLSSGGSSTNDPVAQAATLSSSSAGYKMRLSIGMVAPGIQVTGQGAGVFDVKGRTGALTLSMNFGASPTISQVLGSNSLRIDEIVNGSTIYVKLPDQLRSALKTVGKPWIAFDLTKAAGIPGLSSLGNNPLSNDPSQLLKYLRAVSNSVVTKGQSRIGGRITTQYGATINLDRVADLLPSADQAAARQAISKLEQTTDTHELPVDVWVDSNHLVRRIQTTLNASLPSGQSVQQGVTVDIPEYGPQPKPALPPADQVASVTG
jgi:hypothetical protein